MLYIVKFIYQTFFLPPGFFVMLFLTLGLILFHRQKRRIALILTGCALGLYLSSIPFVSGMLLRPLESRFRPPENPRGDVIILLGGGATGDTPNLRGRGHLTGSAANRLLTALALERELDLPIICSGGKVYRNSGREADIAVRIGLALGTPPDHLYIESQSRNTTENALYLQKILREKRFRRPLLVTSAFHMPRAVGQFAKRGITVTPYPTDYRINQTFRFSWDQLSPSGEAFNEVSLALKEYLGLLMMKWY